MAQTHRDLQPRVVDLEPMLTPGQVAALFRVTPKTITRWAEAGKLPVIRTLGGHRRFPAHGVQAVYDQLHGTVPTPG